MLRLLMIFIFQFSSVVAFSETQWTSVENKRCAKQLDDIVRRSTSPDQCDSEFKKIYVSEKKKGTEESCFASTYGYQWFMENLALCMKHAMEMELDKRLVAMKKTDKVNFTKEMGLQKTFNDVVLSFCSSEEVTDGGTGVSAVLSECLAAFYTYRFGQAKSINQKTLSFKVQPTAPDSCRKELKNFDNYARKLCDMPPNIWRGTKPTAQKCVDLALVDIAKQTRYFASCKFGTPIDRSNEW